MSISAFYISIAGHNAVNMETDVREILIKRFNGALTAVQNGYIF